MKLIPPWLQRPFEGALSPLASGLIKTGIHPNTLTTLGFTVVALSAVAFGVGFVRVGGFFLLLSGAFDVLDGKVARGGGLMSRFGAFYDSTLDRVGDGAIFAGIGLYFMTGGLSDEFVFRCWTLRPHATWNCVGTRCTFGADCRAAYQPCIPVNPGGGVGEAGTEHGAGPR